LSMLLVLDVVHPLCRLGTARVFYEVFSSFSWYTQQMKVEPEFVSSGEKIRGVVLSA
jgi:hypothetical protein